MEEYWNFSRQRLDGASLKFSSDDFERLRDIFMERYGEPTKRWQEQLTTGMGVKATNERLEWRGPTIRVGLDKYSSDTRARWNRRAASWRCATSLGKVGAQLGHNLGHSPSVHCL